MKLEKKNKPETILVTSSIEKQTIQKIKGIAYLKDTRIKHIISAALEEYIKNFEAANGTIQLITKNKN
jgi:hypothetical protein